MGTKKEIIKSIHKDCFDAVANDVVTALKNGESRLIVIVGQKKIGKTTLLKRLRKRFYTQQIGVEYRDCILKPILDLSDVFGTLALSTTTEEPAKLFNIDDIEIGSDELDEDETTGYESVIDAQEGQECEDEPYFNEELQEPEEAETEEPSTAKTTETPNTPVLLINNAEHLCTMLQDQGYGEFLKYFGDGCHTIAILSIDEDESKAFLGKTKEIVKEYHLNRISLEETLVIAGKGNNDTLVEKCFMQFGGTPYVAELISESIEAGLTTPGTILLDITRKRSEYYCRVFEGLCPTQRVIMGALLSRNKTFTLPELRLATGLPGGTITPHLTRLRKLGLIREGVFNIPSKQYSATDVFLHIWYKISTA